MRIGRVFRSVIPSRAARARVARACRRACATPCDSTCPDPCALAALPVGVRAVVVRLACPHGDADRLRVLGLFEGARIEIVDRGSGFLLDVAGARLAIGRALAACIDIQPLA